MRPTIHIGDWVRFYRNGELVIGVVEYMTQDEIMGDRTLWTDRGAVALEDVLETRKAKP